MNTKQYVVYGDYTSKVFTSQVQAEEYARIMSLTEAGSWVVQEQFACK